MADTRDFAYHLTLHCNIIQLSRHTQSFFLKKKFPVAQSLNVRNLYYKMLVGPTNSEGIMTYPWALYMLLNSWVPWATVFPLGNILARESEKIHVLDT